MGRYSSSPPAVRTAGTQSTGDFLQRDGSFCTRLDFKWAPGCENPLFPHLVNLEHVCDVGEDVHVVAEKANVVDAVVADRVADPRPMRPRLEERGESVEKTFSIRGNVQKASGYRRLPSRHLNQMQEINAPSLHNLFAIFFCIICFKMSHNNDNLPQKQP